MSWRVIFFTNILFPFILLSIFILFVFSFVFSFPMSLSNLCVIFFLSFIHLFSFFTFLNQIIILSCFLSLSLSLSCFTLMVVACFWTLMDVVAVGYFVA